MSGLGGLAVDPDLHEGGLLLEEQGSGLAWQVRQGSGEEEGLELFCEGRAGGWVWA